jgi:hypothetical protein
VWEFGDERQRTVVDLAAVNAVIEGANGTHRLHLRGDREGFPVVANYSELLRAIIEAHGGYPVTYYSI